MTIIQQKFSNWFRRACILGAIMLLAVCLPGCATQEDYLQSLQAYNGLPEARLIDKFGVPDKTYEVDGRKYLSFVSRSSTYYPAETGVYGGYGRGRSVFSTGVSSGDRYRTTECENVFVIYKGVVERSGFKGVCY